MFLIAQTFLREYFDTFDLVSGGFIEDGERAPRALILKHGGRITQ
jgi:hypothetical protein